MFSIFNSIGKDKLLHFFWSMILIMPLIYFLGGIYGSIALAIIAGLKELVWDIWLKRGNGEFLDFVYGCLPIPIYFILHSI